MTDLTSSISGLLSHVQTEQLEITGHAESLLEAILDQEKLSSLRLQETTLDLQDAEPVLSRLKVLCLYRTHQQHYRWLQKAGKLESLSIAFQKNFASVAPIGELASLLILDVSSQRKLTGLQDLGQLRRLKLLSFLDLGDIPSVKWISSLHELWVLKILGDCTIRDGKVAFLKNMPQLAYVGIRPRRIYDADVNLLSKISAAEGLQLAGTLQHTQVDELGAEKGKLKGGMPRSSKWSVVLLLWAGIVSVAFGRLSPEAEVGRRLFEEPRFAQFFCEHCGGNVNFSLIKGDPALETLVVGSDQSIGPSKNASARRSISCASCHLGAEYRDQPGLPAGGVTLFADFASRSPVTRRSDLHLTTIRNAPSLVGLSAMSKTGWGLRHWDGEFTSLEELIAETFTGRNFGWLPEEETEAQRHFARIIREDDGNGDLARHLSGLSYATLFRGMDPAIPARLRLKESFRFDPAKATDEQILHRCAQFVAEYISSLDFSRDSHGLYDGSPYDAFLAANHLPQEPNLGEIPAAYARRLHSAIAAIRHPKFIDDPDRRLKLHNQPFHFGELELRGLRIFFRATLGEGVKGSAGNCAECHVPPHFTDGSFHNTGEAQMDYDAIHGVGAFAKLAVPTLVERNRDEAHWLPATRQNPQGLGIFLSVPSSTAPERTDLGLWNVYGNSHLSRVQAVVEKKLNAEGRLSTETVLESTLARFKTPTVRDLGQSAPYLHTGRLRTLEDAVIFYQQAGDLAHEGKLRNAPREFSSMKLNAADIEPLVAFLRSLNEDYEAVE